MTFNAYKSYRVFFTEKINLLKAKLLFFDSDLKAWVYYAKVYRTHLQ